MKTKIYFEGQMHAMDVRIEAGWKQALKEEFQKPYFDKLMGFVREEYGNRRIFPPGRQIFNAFDRCPFSGVKVVILGQDPYHGPGQANGLCFSVNDNIPKPPSLINIFRELETDLGISQPPTGNLEKWADQGVLLLNATLTVRAHQAGSHQGRGWEQFTDRAIELLATQRSNLVFILWGSYAHKKGALIDSSRHLVISTAHPSPLSAHRGFFGSRPFSRANLYLQKHGKVPIDW